MNKTEKDIIECFTKAVKDELLNRNYEILKGWYEFCELMEKCKLSIHNWVYYKLLEDKPCDYNCIHCWGKIYDKLKEEN